MTYRCTTHRKGHTLDIVITPDRESFLQDVNVTDIDLSDHFLIDFQILKEPAVPQTKTITYRSTRNLDLERFSNDVQVRLNSLPPATSFLEKVTNYNLALTEIVTDHAPIKTREIKVVPKAPWFDAEYADQRKISEKQKRNIGRQVWKLTRRCI